MVENFFPYTAMGTPLSPTRAAHAAFLARIFSKAARFSLNLLTNSFCLTISEFLLTMVEETANIYRVNKLLELEAADWQRQLEKAVGGFKVRSPVLFISHCMELVSDPSGCFRVSLTSLCQFMRRVVCSTGMRKGPDMWWD